MSKGIVPPAHNTRYRKRGGLLRGDFKIHNLKDLERVVLRMTKDADHGIHADAFTDANGYVDWHSMHKAQKIRSEAARTVVPFLRLLLDIFKEQQRTGDQNRQEPDSIAAVKRIKELLDKHK
jgi:hypothetical protein